MDDLAKADWSDPEKVEDLSDSYKRRYGEDFWTAFCNIIRSPHPKVVADFGCGPGLFLYDSVTKLGAERVFGLDASREMLDQAKEFLTKVLPEDKFTLKEIDFNREALSLQHDMIDLAFSGYVIHELDNPLKLLKAAKDAIAPGGEYVILDFISGDPEGFVEAMVEGGMEEPKARARYPHMCKNSLGDLRNLISDAGFVNIHQKKTESFRALTTGIKRKIIN